MLEDLLKSFNSNRLPEMVQLKYKAMAENAFRFFRGTCHLFYHHLAYNMMLPKSPKGWMCGDLHLENFGSYKGDNKLTYFDLNDFDEAILAPVLWEVVRLVSSIFVAFEVMEIGEDQAMNMASLFLNSYAGTLLRGKAVAIDPRTAKGMVQAFLKHADRRRYKDLLGKRTIAKGKKNLLSLSHEKHFKVDKQLKTELIAHISEWIALSSVSPYNFKVKDVVFRFAGTGSVGVKRYLFLLKSTNCKGQYLLIDMKQSFGSSLLPVVSVSQPIWENESDRIISVQKRMQYVSSSLLDRTVFKGDFYVLQELQPMEDTFDFSFVRGDYRNLIQVIDDMGVLTASAQLRSSGMQGSSNIDKLMEFGNTSEKWKERVIATAKAMATQNALDYHEFMKGYLSGNYKNEVLTNEKIISETNEKREKIQL